MKRMAILITMILLASLAVEAQAPAQGQTPPAQPGQQAPAGQPAAPAGGKGQPQAKTQEEFKAYQAAAQLQGGQDLAAAEAAADQFSTQYAESDLRPLLYQNLMSLYQQRNNADKTVSVGRKLLGIDPNNPVALVMVATVLAERTRETDLDKDERFAEAMRYAKKSLEVVDQMPLPPTVTPEQATAAKNTVISMAYGALGTIASTQENWGEAEQQLKKSIAVPGLAPDPLTMLRLSIVLDHMKKYPEALQVANKTVEIAQDPILSLARQERDRLVKLTAAPAAPAPAGAPPAGAAPQANPAPTTPAPAGAKPTQPAQPPQG